MKQLLGQESTCKIQKYFFPTGEKKDLDIQKLVSNQINRHQHVLTYRNKNLLKTLLKSNQDGELDSTDLKMVYESGTNIPANHEDVHQYLTFNDDIDFGDCLQRN